VVAKHPKFDPGGLVGGDIVVDAHNGVEASGSATEFDDHLRSSLHPDAALKLFASERERVPVAGPVRDGRVVAAGLDAGKIQRREPDDIGFGTGGKCRQGDTETAEQGWLHWGTGNLPRRGG